jgi:hypothetical protein
VFSPPAMPSRPSTSTPPTGPAADTERESLPFDPFPVTTEPAAPPANPKTGPGRSKSKPKAGNSTHRR